MGRNRFTLFVILGIFVSLLGQNFQFAHASDPQKYIFPKLIPAWTSGIISDSAGPVKIVAMDLNKDNKTDIAACSNGYLYILNYTTALTYDTVWFSENIGCRMIATADRDSNGILELYVATNQGHVLVIDSQDYQTIASLELPPASAINDIEVSDVDSDGVLEIILACTDATLIYDINTFHLEWQATGLGGDQVAAGNIDNDPQVEIVVNGNPAHVLNASLKTQKWGYSGGFGSRMSLGDVDGDNQAEIVYTNLYNIYVMDGDTQTIQWQLNNVAEVYLSKVADVDSDGKSEIIIGNGQWGKVTGYRGSDGTKLWSIANPEHGVFALGVGDTNNDGTNEIIWSAGLSSSGKDALFVGSWVTQTVEWESDDLDGPLLVAAGDVDADGQEEIIMASTSTTSGYEGGTIRIYDGTTHLVEWSTVLGSAYYNIYQLAVGQLDSDIALEILVGCDNWYDTRLAVYDGASHLRQWQSPDMGSGAPRALKIKELDGDGVDEIAVGLSDQHVQILHGASQVIQWDSGALDAGILDLAFGDLDGNGVMDLAVMTVQSVYVFNTTTWVQTKKIDMIGGQKLAINNPDQKGAGELLLLISTASAPDYITKLTLKGVDGASYNPLWQKPLGNVVIKNMEVADLDSDGSEEFILMGRTGTESNSPSLLWIGSQNYPSLWENQISNRHLESIYSMALSDVDHDGKVEFLLGSSAVFQVNDIIPVSGNFVYLPQIEKPGPPRGLYGTVTEDGTPVSGVPLELRFFNGSSWSTVTTSNTSSDGSYSFLNIPGLNDGQRYYIRYQNSSSGYLNRLWTWHTKTIDTYRAGTNYRIGDFDLANIALYSPGSETSVTLPGTFQWIVRNIPSDSYEFDLYDPYDSNTIFFTNPALGYENHYTLNNLPPGFSQGKLYAWDVWVYSPDGGFGVSYDSWAVYFSNSGFMNLLDDQPVQPKINSDMRDLSIR